MTTPRCGVHVATVMVLVEATAPKWVMNPDGAEQFMEDTRGGAAHKTRFQRKYWKCPQPGCVRVAAYSPSEEEEKRMAERPCSKCGEPTTARVYCSDCLANYEEKRSAERRAVRAARAGAGKGFYASARAKRIARDLAGEEPEKEFAIRDGEIVATEAVA